MSIDKTINVYFKYRKEIENYFKIEKIEEIIEDEREQYFKICDSDGCVYYGSKESIENYTGDYYSLDGIKIYKNKEYTLINGDTGSGYDVNIILDNNKEINGD